jgi:hypothetical protein
VDENYVLNWLVVQIFQNTFALKLDKLWLQYQKLKLYSYILGLYQLESIIILIDVLFSSTCNFILQNYDTYFLVLTYQKMYLNAY